MPTLKVLLMGLPGAGKTEFIKSVSDLPLVSVQKKIVSTEELVDMDYGRVHIDRNMVYLYAPVSDSRFNFFWESLHEEMHGFILLVDASKSEEIERSAALLKFLTNISDCPHVTAFTKVDLRAESSVNALHTDAFGPPQMVVSCICTRKTSARGVIQTLLDCFRKQNVL